jgi:hypothetical protein
MKKITTILLFMNAAVLFAQKDSVNVNRVDSAAVVKTVSKPDNENAEKKYEGVSVSPSTLRLAVKPGTSQTREIKVVNDSKNKMTFQIVYSDFMMGRNGKPMASKPEVSKYALSKWLSASPSFFELKPGASQKITLTIAVPGSDEGSVAGWTIMMIDQVTEKSALNLKGNDKTIAMGVLPSIGFGVYIYQNPPNVKINDVEIQKFAYLDSIGKKNLSLQVKNTGDGIGFCTSYVELTGLNDGKKQKLNVKQYTILPGFYRDFLYELPKTLPKGKYSAVGVIDYSNEQEIKAAELEFTIE